jgi:preprotein translocase subunit SecG
MIQIRIQNPKTIQSSMKKFSSSKRGAIGILTTLVMGLVLVMAAVSLVLNNISSRASAFSLSRSEQALISTEGCAEEGLLRLSRNPAYPGGSLTLGDVACLLTVGDDGTTLEVVGSDGLMTHRLLVTVATAPAFHVSGWSDL